MTEELELSPDAIRLLVGMRELLQHGWIQFQEQSAAGYCLVGAANQMMERLWPRERARALAASLRVGVLLGAECGFVSIWNDAPSRTQEEVLQMLDGILGRMRK